MGDYYGLKTGIVQNQFLQLEYLLEGGLRIVRLMPAGEPVNFLAETPDFGWETPLGWYELRGGHRLWTAPQHLTHPDVPETQTLAVEECEEGVRLVQAADAFTGIRKSIEIQLVAGRPAAVIHHHLFNDSLCPVELSAWAISQVPSGGRIILPQADPPAVTKGAGPDRHLVFWPYNNLPDERLSIKDRWLTFDVRLAEHEFKLGTYTPQGWVGYVWKNHFFRKQFQPQGGQTYPDMGCNVEIYSNHTFAEIETLSPLVKLEPGETIQHSEAWELLSMQAARETLGSSAYLLDE
jgi:hypothetical protein